MHSPFPLSEKTRKIMIGLTFANFSVFLIASVVQITQYYLKEDNCNNKFTNKPNCQTCNAINSCSICMEGYYLQDGECINTCRSKPNIYCQTCNSINSCFSCIEGYYIQNGKCINTCINKANCLTCNGINSCYSCKEGYYLKDGDCNACDKSCRTCKNYDQHSCTSCKESLFLSLDGDCW